MKLHLPPYTFGRLATSLFMYDVQTNLCLLQDTGEVLMPQDMKKAQVYANKKICFENEEINEIKKFDDPGKIRICQYLQLYFQWNVMSIVLSVIVHSKISCLFERYVESWWIYIADKDWKQE